MDRDYCDKCHGFVLASDLDAVQVCRQTHSSPAEYEGWCSVCRGVDDDRDPDYERAAARYDGEGKDWR